MILLPQLPECCGYRHVPHPAIYTIFERLSSLQAFTFNFLTKKKFHKDRWQKLETRSFDNDKIKSVKLRGLVSSLASLEESAWSKLRLFFLSFSLPPLLSPRSFVNYLYRVGTKTFKT